MRQSVRRISRRTPVAIKRIAHQRSVPSVSADLETICRKPYGRCDSMIRLPLRSMQQDTVSTVSASKIKFDGFMAVYVQDEEEKSEGKSSRERNCTQSTELTL